MNGGPIVRWTMSQATIQMGPHRTTVGHTPPIASSECPLYRLQIPWFKLKSQSRCGQVLLSGSHPQISILMRNALRTLTTVTHAAALESGLRAPG